MAEMIGGLNLVLLGKIGTGKSASGNTILGQQAFLTSVTQDMANNTKTVCGRRVTVYDTPGLFNTKLGEKKIEMIYENVLQRCESGPCVFLLVIEADRFIKIDEETVEKIEKLLGEKRLEKTLILFTRGDELEEENKTIDEFINGSKALKRLVQKYDQRYHVFNNNKRGHTGQVQELLKKIDAIEKGEKLKRRSTVHEQQISRMIKMLFGWLTRWIPVRLHAPDKSDVSRRIVLLGKTGAGKSAAGNTILGQEVFEEGYGPYTVTRECSDAQVYSDRSVSVVDTPGFIHTHMNTVQLVTEIAKSVYLSSPGPHAFLIVFRANDRFTEQEELIPQMIEIMFGQEVLKYSIILFTHGDQLDGESVEELIECSSRLRDLVDQCGGKYHVFNNKDQNNREQVNDLLQKIDTMIEQNDGYYSNQMFEDAQRFRQEEERRHREEKKRKRQEEKAINGSLTRRIPARLHAPDKSDTSRRIVLLGKTGAGKSAAVNTILEWEVFGNGYGPYSVTSKCSDAQVCSVRPVCVVDTPGFIHTHMTTGQLVTEIAKSVYLFSPNAFLIVLRANDRYTDQEQQIPQMIEIMFGQEVLKYSIILFTHGDRIDKPIADLIEQNSKLRDLVDQCGGRFHVFNNKDQRNREQVNDLLQKIDTMIEQNGGGHYSNQMLEEVQRLRQEEEERRQREEEERKRQEEKQIQDDIERLRKETEEKIRAEFEGPPRFLLERLKQMREREEKQEETERVIHQIKERVTTKLHPSHFGRRKFKSMWRDEIKKQRQEEIERVIKETEEKIREELEGPPRFISSHILMRRREVRERQRLKEIERVIKETVERPWCGPQGHISRNIYLTLMREIDEERERQLQEENKRQEEIERVRKETEERIRAELEAKISELERLKVEIQREEEERKQQEEKSRQEEIERVIEETVERIGAWYRRPAIHHKISRQREEVRKLQEEKQRQEEIERVRKETEERIRAEIEAERSELERLKVEIKREDEVRKQLENKQRLEERAIERRQRRRAEQNMNYWFY